MFESFTFTDEQISKYYQAALKDFHIIAAEKTPEVIFYLSYNVLIKSAMAICAKNNLRVKSRAGHHIELIARLATYLNDPEIEITANKMRTKRNRDLYDGGVSTSQKEAEYYSAFTGQVIKATHDYIYPNTLGL